MPARTATSDDILVPLRGPSGEPVDLWRTLVSHGFHELAPVALDEQARTLSLTLRMPRGTPRRVTIGQGPRRSALVTTTGSSPSAAARASIAAQVARVLHLDHDLASFYAVATDDPDLAWATTGRRQDAALPHRVGGRDQDAVHHELLVGPDGDDGAGVGDEPRRASAWARGIRCTNAFPTPEAMAERDEAFYREVVRSGYRAPSFVRLSNIVASGELDLEALGAASREDLPDGEVEAQLLALPGIGPYAAAHIMMTLGRNSKLILDSWTRPTYKRLSGAKRQPTDAQIQRRFRRYGPDAGLAFWLYVTRDWVALGLPRLRWAGILPEAIYSHPAAPCGADPERTERMKECRWRLVAPSHAAPSGSSATGGPKHGRFARAWSRSSSARPPASSPA